jgi:hypothetical protein
VPKKNIVTFAEGGCQIEAGDTATRSAPVGVVAPKDDGRPVELTEDSRRNDSHNAYVPMKLALYDDVMLFGIKC